ncbi:MAG: hypothetical protein EP312_01365 [Gammaproteobacteria bacterium]|nr:MAG: hypothetical protein EP312_01365 [Gammaproteobacteria bacterium]
MDASTIHHAVFFFDKGKIVKEMLWSEFEAVLDNVVGLPQFENQTMQSVFVKINSQLKVTACVFFLIKFGAGGQADPTWNMPLHQLSDAAGKGPDLGVGPIKLACKSQCPAAWHQQSMWDPDLNAKPSAFDAIKDAAKRNRLALVYIEADAAPTAAKAIPVVGGAAVAANVDVEALRAQIQQEERERTEGAIKAAKLQLATLANQHKEEVDALHRDYLRDMRDDHKELLALRESLAQAEAKVQKLEATTAEQAKAMEAARHEFVAQAGAAGGVSAEALKELEARLEAEFKAKLEAESRGLKEELEMKAVELTYRDEQMNTLREEVANLHQDKQRMLRDSAGNLLDKLEKSGISFVGWNPSLGHINIPLAEMGVFLDSPDAWYAKKTDVPQELYEAWMAHYSFPVCQAELEDGGMCGEPIERVDSAAKFLPGRSDCCPAHQKKAAG